MVATSDPVARVRYVGLLTTGSSGIRRRRSRCVGGLCLKLAYKFPSGNYLVVVAPTALGRSRTVISALPFDSEASNVPGREHSVVEIVMPLSVEQVGEVVKSARKSLGVTQRQLALTAGTGLRFVIDLEKGKRTCQLGKTLAVLNTLGVAVEFRDGLGQID